MASTSFMRMHWTFLFGPEERLRPGLWWLETLNLIHVVLSEGDVVIRYGAIVHKELAHAGEQFQTCGLHGVLTFPDFRNEGYASQLVAAASQHIREQCEADIALLFCAPELVPFYACAGWEHRENAVTLISPADSPSQSESAPEHPDHRLMLFVSQKGQ